MTGRPELNWPTVMYTEEVIREGFGIESVHIPVQAKVDLIHALSDTGLKRMTVGAFVSPRFVPQMACFEELLSRFTPRQGVSYLTFVHNQRARQKAQQFAPPLTIEAEMCHLTLDICDVHQMRNVNRTKQEIIATWPALISQARQQGIRQGRVAIYSAWGSNFMGKFSQAQRLLELTRQIEMLQAADIEVVEIGLHDSQSWCLPHEMEADLQEIKRRWPDVHHFHLHMHDAAVDGQRQGVAPVEGIAFGLAFCSAHHIAGGSHISAVALVGELPDALFLRAVGVNKVFIQDTLVTLPMAFHLYREALHHLAVAVGEDAPRVHHAIEVGAQVEHRFLVGIVVNGRAGAATQVGGDCRAGHAAE